jgi:opacity protein-like surface antigen
MRHCILFILSFVFTQSILSQTCISGKILDNENQPVINAPVLLKTEKDSTLFKGAISDDQGSFYFERLPQGNYFIEIDYIGMQKYTSGRIEFMDQNPINLGDISLLQNSQLMNEVTVTSKRSILEVKPDRTVFNVQGTINASGQSGINLLRKAPGILIDNNNNITVLGRSGVLIYVDGKRIPLSGDELSNFLNTINSEQIDRIDIITNPGAKYEAQGNAGIIDIKLKKDENLGSNGSLSTNISQGKYTQANLNLLGNHRTKLVNIFGNVGTNKGKNWSFMEFSNFQNSIRTNEKNDFFNVNNGYNARLGVDFFISKYQTIGILANAGILKNKIKTNNITVIYPSFFTKVVDSILVAINTGQSDQDQGAINFNYTFDNSKNKVSIDINYASYINSNFLYQSNQYFQKDTLTLRSENLHSFDTPRDINIGTVRMDYETTIGKGSLSTGLKLSQVNTINTFLFYDIFNGQSIRNNRRSNKFEYEELVYAGYINYASKISEKWNLSSGLRAEYTNARGDLSAFTPDLEEGPVYFKYISFFPSTGLSYNHSPKHNWALNYSRRINRPNYNVLNPFREQISELSYSKGNKNLQPEKIHNLELGYTFNYMYNVKLGFSRTDNQITRLIGPDNEDPRAGFISWDNLATQDIFSLNASLPFTINKWWSLYLNAAVTYTDNRADYGNEGKVDVQAGSYSLYQQSTFNLGKGYTGEISGWYSGPGVWGGVFLFDPSYSLDLGLQKKFIKERLNVKISASDVTYQSKWSGYSEFNGLRGEGKGGWDSRRISLNLSYELGNKKVKSRKRNVGLEEESKRVASS